MTGPFEARRSDLESLGDEEAVDLVRRLVWADAAASGIGQNLVNVPSAISVRDGGVDGEVAHADADGRYGIIKKGITRYQVKSGRFSPNTSSIKKILLSEPGVLKDRIKHCLDRGGTLVVAFTKWDDPDAAEDAAAGRFREVLAEVSHSYAAAKVEIWRQNTLLGFLERLPALRLSLVPAPDSGHCSLREWSRLADMKEDIYMGASQKKFVGDLRGHIRSEEGPVHVRVLGEPGIGKTRLVLEACSAPDLAELVVYVDDPARLEGSGLLGWLARRGDATAILVVDECDYEARVYNWNRLRQYSPRIKLVTIYNEPGEEGRETAVMKVPPLSGAEIDKILSEYGIGKADRPKWARLCGPYPRAARMIGQNVRARSGEPLGDSETVSGWERLIASRLSIGSPEHKARKAVLLWLSLFKRFGYEGSYADEGRAISGLISRIEGVSRGDFRRIVGDLRRMRVLQGSSTVYITPKVLHIHLWLEWWRTYGDDELSEALEMAGGKAGGGRGGGSLPDLERWLYGMFEYAGESEGTRRAAERLLEAGHLLGGAEGELRAEAYSAYHLPALSRAAPVPVLSYLEKAVASKPAEDLRRFKGRRGVVDALDYMARQTGHAERAAGVLLALAEAENEEFVVNNATGTLCGMFAPHASRMSLAGRLEMLKSIGESASEDRKRLAVRACRKAIEPRAAGEGADFGAGQYPPPGAAEDDRYRLGALDILGTRIKEAGPLADEAAGAVLEVAGPLLREPALRGKVLELLEAIRASGRRPEELASVAARAADRGAQDMDEASLDRLRALRRDEGGDGDDVRARLKRYVGPSANDDIFRGGGLFGGMGDEYDRRQRHRASQILELAREVSHDGILGGELGWLVTGEAEEGRRFGYALAVHDAGYAMLTAILAAVRSAGPSASGRFAGGYLAHVCENDPERWNAVLGAVYDDDRCRAVLPEMVRISGINDRSASLVLRGVSSGKLPCKALGVLRHPNSVSDGTFAGCVEELLRRPDREEAAAVALRLVHARLVREGKELPRRLLAAVLFNPGVARGALSSTDEWMWKEAVIRLIDAHPDECLPAARTVVENFWQPRVSRRHDTPPLEILGRAARIRPEEVWGVLSGRIGPPLGRGHLWLTLWLRGDLADEDRGALSAFPLRLITAWVAEDPGARAAHMAGLLPEDIETIRGFLSEYGDRDDVRSGLAENLLRRKTTLPPAEHYRAMRSRYAALHAGERHPVVRAWLGDFLRRLDACIDRAVEEDLRGW